MWRLFREAQQFTQAGFTGGDSKTNGWHSPLGHPHRTRPADSTGHCPGAHTDLRSRILGIELRFPPRPLGTRCCAAGAGGGDLRQGYRIAVDIDPAKFFDTVDFDLPMHHVGTKVRDKWVLALIGKYLRAGVKVEYRLRTLSTNQWLKDQGLVSVKELWVKTHYPATAR